MQAIIVQLLTAFTPLVLQGVSDWKAANPGQEPTSEQVLALLQANIDKYLAEGAAWTATHPTAG